MAKMIRMTIDGHDISFVCSSRDTRSGFAHDATIFIDGRDCGTSHAYYLNRTWERYAYESVCLSRVSDLTAARMADLKYDYKISKGLTRLTAKHKAALDALIDSDEKIALLRKIRDDLRTKMY